MKSRKGLIVGVLVCFIAAGLFAGGSKEASPSEKTFTLK